MEVVLITALKPAVYAVTPVKLLLCLHRINTELAGCNKMQSEAVGGEIRDGFSLPLISFTGVRSMSHTGLYA